MVSIAPVSAASHSKHLPTAAVESVGRRQRGGAVASSSIASSLVGVGVEVRVRVSVLAWLELGLGLGL